MIIKAGTTVILTKTINRYDNSKILAGSEGIVIGVANTMEFSDSPVYIVQFTQGGFAFVLTKQQFEVIS